MKKKNQSAPPPQKIHMTLDEYIERELPPLSQVVSFCNNLPVSLYADSTVVKSPEVVFRGLLLSQNRLLSEEYLLNSRRSDADLSVVIGANNYSLPMAVAAMAKRDAEENDEGLIPLPPYKNERAPLGAVIRSRRSVRNYSGQPISLEHLSTILFHCGGISGQTPLAGVNETAFLGDDPQIDLRVTASGGAMYPIDLHLVALKVQELPVGVYRYVPKNHALKFVGSASGIPDPRMAAQFFPIEVEKAGFLIGYVYNLFENARKYGDMALGFAMIEAGAIAAHVHLLCTALGLGSCDVGSFSKRHFERLFDTDGISRHIIHLTVVGK
jgi:SagB-type dehydrogenase family enzyme